MKCSKMVGQTLETSASPDSNPLGHTNLRTNAPFNVGLTETIFKSVLEVLIAFRCCI